MSKPSSLWRLFRYGLKWGALISMASALSLPALYEMYLWLTAILNKDTYLGPIGWFVPEVWVLFFGLGFLHSLVPTIVGGCVLGASIYLLVSRESELVKCSMWIGISVGAAVGVCYLSLFFASDWSFSIREDWLLAALILVWEMIMYAWLGRYLAYKTINSGQCSR